MLGDVFPTQYYWRLSVLSWLLFMIAALWQTKHQTWVNNGALCMLCKYFSPCSVRNQSVHFDICSGKGLLMCNNIPFKRVCKEVKLNQTINSVIWIYWLIQLITYNLGHDRWKAVHHNWIRRPCLSILSLSLCDTYTRLLKTKKVCIKSLILRWF